MPPKSRRDCKGVHRVSQVRDKEFIYQWTSMTPQRKLSWMTEIADLRKDRKGRYSLVGTDTNTGKPVVRAHAAHS